MLVMKAFWGLFFLICIEQVTLAATYIERSHHTLFSPRKYLDESALLSESDSAGIDFENIYQVVCQKFKDERAFAIVDPRSKGFQSNLRQDLSKIESEWDGLSDSEKELLLGKSPDRTVLQVEDSWIGNRFVELYSEELDHYQESINILFSEVRELAFSSHSTSEESRTFLKEVAPAIELKNFYKRFPFRILDTTMSMLIFDGLGIGGELLFHPRSSRDLFAFVMSHEYTHAFEELYRIDRKQKNRVKFSEINQCIVEEYCSGDLAVAQPSYRCASEIQADWGGAEIFSRFLEANSDGSQDNLKKRTLSVLGTFCGYGGHQVGGHPPGDFRMKVTLSHPYFMELFGIKSKPFMKCKPISF